MGPNKGADLPLDRSATALLDAVIKPVAKIVTCVRSQCFAGVKITLRFHTSNIHYGFSTIGKNGVYTHVTVEEDGKNWLSFGAGEQFTSRADHFESLCFTDGHVLPIDVDRFSHDALSDVYGYGVRIQIISTGSYGAFEMTKLVGQLTTVKRSVDKHLCRLPRFFCFIFFFAFCYLF